MIKPIYSPGRGKMRVMGFASGSGNTLWKVLELQRELENTFEGSPFEVVGVFCDNPNSKAVEAAKTYGIPCITLDIREYYARHGKPLKDRMVRAQYDKEAVELIKPFKPDVILLAGYVWAITDIMLDNYTFVNVHPADLSIQIDGHRAYAGANGVGDALNAKEAYLCSTSHLATKELDGGPILIISPKVHVDYSAKNDDKEFYRYYLNKVNEQSRLVGARTIYEIALGNFGFDNYGQLYYKGNKLTAGYRIESWDSYKPEYACPVKSLIAPRSIAVIGASAKGGIGHAVIKNIKALEFLGHIYAVNKKGEEVLGVQGYESMLKIPDEVDLGIITVPSGSVLQVAEECGQKGVKALVCISAGFKEVGGEGVQNEQKLMEIVRKYNMRMLGPNCMGILNTSKDVRLNATILHNIPDSGGISFVTQSGALGAAILDFAEELGLGFSIIASLGNQPDININDLLPLLAEDEQTKVILLYLESIPEPEKFAYIAKKTTEKKPIIIIKSGRTSSGARAASSHTGSLAGNDSVADALIRKTGAIRVNTLEEAFLLASALSKMPYMKGNKVGIVTNAGGPGILVADALDNFGFEVQTLKEELRAKLALELLPEASTANPIDLVAPAPPQHYAKAIETMLVSEQYDALLLVCVPPATINTGEVAKACSEALAGSNIPVLSCFFGPTLGKPGRIVMHRAGIPSFTYPEQLAQILSLMQKKESSCQPPVSFETPKAPTKAALQNMFKKYAGSYMPVSKCEILLKEYGINIARSAYLTSKKEAEALEFTYPLVAKIDHPDIIHKSDAGGVILNINNKDELIEKVEMLITKFPRARGVQIQEQLPNGPELILGAVWDPNLGHALMAGLGGTMVEILKDISFGHVPVDSSIAEDMISSLKSYPLLKGYRGAEGVNLDELKGQIIRLSNLLMDFPEIEELDLNPLIWVKERNTFVAADCRIKVR